MHPDAWLVVIDPQRIFADPASEWCTPWFAGIVPRVRELIAAYEFLRRVDAKLILSYLQDEHPQTITLVLAHMGAEQAAIILSGLAPEMQAEVAHRLAIMDRTSPEIVKQVETQLELAEQVRAQMFMFEDIVGLEDRAVQVVLRKVDSKDLAVALKGVREDVREKITRNMSERAALSLADEVSILGPVRLKQVEESQAVVIRQIRMLEEAGEIVVSRGGGDEFVA